MPDPGDAQLALLDFRKSGSPPAGALGEERRNEDTGEEIALMPIGARAQPDAGGAFGSGAIPGHLANDIASASFWNESALSRKHISWPQRSKIFCASTPDPSPQAYNAAGQAPLQVNILERILPASDRVVCGHLEIPAQLRTVPREGVHRLYE